MKKIDKIGYKIAVSGIVVVLFWIGFFKITPTEAAGIKPYVENHFAMSWMYKVMSIQAVSNIIGLFEIIVGIGLIWSLFKPQVGKIFGWAAFVIFATTLSFLLTTPHINTVIDGVPATDFFVLKDIMALGISLMVVYNEVGLAEK
jgi:reactive chlorine resistance protein C